MLTKLREMKCNSCEQLQLPVLQPVNQHRHYRIGANRLSGWPGDATVTLTG